MAKPIILIVEDDPDGCRSVKEAVEDMGYGASVAMTGKDGLRLFAEGRVDTVLTDLVLPDIDGLKVLAAIREADPGMPVMIMTAYGTVSSAVDALKAGAYDYITKPLDLDDIQTKVKRAVETRSLRRQVEDLSVAVGERYGTESMVAESPGMIAVVEQIHALKDTNATVLIQGESGTGKEVVARALHADGNRRGGPFVAVNCGAFTETILESELFGHEKGAFTGAVSRHKGAFERADGGTLFLDEVGIAPASVQVKLLRVLEERELMRVGGQRPVSVDVRLLSASNRDLEELVGAGEFREDLLYRLKVVTIDIPPLRGRQADIRVLADRFLAASCAEHGRSVAGMTPACYALLEGFEWPGNVRQLRNVIESAVIMARGRSIEPDDLRLTELKRREDADFVVPDDTSMEQLEKEILLQLLHRHKGNRTIVADKLAISRRTIQRKIKDYRLPF